MRWRAGLTLCMLGLVALPAWAQLAGEVVFVSGSVQVGALRDAAVQVGTPVEEGEPLQTGHDGHLYIRLADRGVLILRPDSRATVTEYRAGEAASQDGRLRIDVSAGVVRSVTGRWGKQAPQRFRLNTPVAALGVRGTDFTVQVLADATRATVSTGAIVMAPFGGECSAQGLGPCGGAAAAVLQAGNPDLALQITAGGSRPILINARQQGLHPDSVAPPLPQEKDATTPADSSSKTILETHHADALTMAPSAGESPIQQVAPPTTTLPPEPRHVVWGRWAVLLDAATPTTLRDGRDRVASNGQFGLFRDTTAVPLLPREGTASFRLADQEAYFLPPGKDAVAATLSDARLTMDFAARTFATQLQMQGGGLATSINAKGGLLPDGRFSSSVLGSDAAVRGTLASGDQAGYVFQKTLPEGTQAFGATYWTK